MRAENTYPGHESSDRSIIRPVLYGAILFVLALILLLVASGAITGTGQNISPPSTASLREPVLQVDPVADMNAMEVKETQWLNSYGWVDRDAGIVRIPIDRAIELTAEQGLK